MTRKRLASAAAAGLLLLAAGCRTGPARSDRIALERAMAVQRAAQAAPAGLIFVVAVYGVGEKGPVLRIAEARRLAADPPLLQDAPGLAGRIELLDAAGRVVSSMGYLPPVPAPSAAAGPASGGEVRLLLRAPDHPGARSVRLRDRGAVAEAPIARPE